MNKPQARALQQELANAGFYKGQIDGLWGNQSNSALIEYEKATGKQFDLGDYVITDSIRGVDLVRHGNTLFTYTGATVDIDGGPHAYHPDNKGLDSLVNAGYPGNWYGVVTDSHGHFVLQGPNDPAPGYCISTTSLKVKGASSLIARQVNAETIPFIVLPGGAPFAKLGDYGTLWYPKNNTKVHVIFADVGPRSHYGEISYYAARSLGIPSSPRNGGIDSGLFYFIYPKTGRAELNPITNLYEIDPQFLNETSITLYANQSFGQMDLNAVKAYYNLK